MHLGFRLDSKQNYVFRVLKIQTSGGGFRVQENRPALLKEVQNRTIKIARLNTLRRKFIFKMHDFDDVHFRICTVLKFTQNGLAEIHRNGSRYR